MTEPAADQSEPRFPIVAVVAAWVLPGLGHVILGKRRRGLLLMISIISLYLAGLLIGGINVIDSREDRLWYFGQVVAGPATFVIDRVHQSRKADAINQWRNSSFRPPYPPVENYSYTVSVGRVNELGTLYCTMAGLLNLLAIIDVLFFSVPRTEREPKPALRGRIVTRDNVKPEGADA